MSMFRIVYRHNDHDTPPTEEVEATEFVEREPWIVFLDPAGTCLTIRSEDVARIERVQLAVRAPDAPARLPSDPPVPAA
jgi:hypothetical protein